MRLYLLAGCPFAHRVAISLREKGLAFEPVFFERGKRPAELEALGPLAKSPTLFDGELKVFDSNTVLEYLEDRYPEPALLPRDAASRAEVRMLEVRLAAELGPSLGTAAHGGGDAQKVEEARRSFVAALGPWDARLAGRAFLAGDALTLADLVLYTPLVAMKRLARVEVPAELGALAAFRDRMAARSTTACLT
ncbi:MAG TPA: glutathione S-transferase family protein [Minicystis sp.]|nr:glutathione S-transferase family protein [Minicystis sp.]